MHNIDIDSIVEYAIEKVKAEILGMRGSKVKAIDIDDINYNGNRIGFQVIGYNAAAKAISEDYFTCSINFEDAPAESEDDVKWLIDNNVPEFAYNFVKNPVRPSMREELKYKNNYDTCGACGATVDGYDITEEDWEKRRVRYTCPDCGNTFDRSMYGVVDESIKPDASYNVQFYQIFSNPEKPTDNGKMIAQAGTEDEAKAKGDKLVGKGNYLIKAVCDDGRVRDVDLHDYFNKSKDLKEYYRGEDALDDVLSWLQDHKQAWDDFTAHFSDVKDEDLTYDMVIDWISEHDTLYDDYLAFFDLDESKSMAADEMKSKHGTDNPDIINAGKPEEERVALKEDYVDIDSIRQIVDEEFPHAHEELGQAPAEEYIEYFYDLLSPDYVELLCNQACVPIASFEKVIEDYYNSYMNESLTEGANAYNVTFYMDSLDDNVMSGPSTTKKIYAASKEEAEKKLRDECTDKYYIPTITDIELVESIVTEELKPGDRVYVTVSNRQGNVIKMVSDDIVEVELDGGLYPARIDRFYVDEVELLDMQPEVDDEIDYEYVDPDAVIDSLKAESIKDPELEMDEDLGHTIGTALFCTASIEVCTIGGVDEDGEDVDEPVIFDDKTPVNTILAAIDPDTDVGDAKCAEINQLLNAMPDGYIQVQAYCRGRDMGDRQVYDAYELYDEIRDIFNLDESLTESNNAYTYRGHYIINDGSTWMIKDGNNQVIRSGIATDSEAEEIIDDLDESVDYNDKFIPDDDM